MFFRKDNNAGKNRGEEKKGIPNVKWIDSIKEAIGVSLQELSRAVEKRECGHHSFVGSSGIGANSTPRDTHTLRCKDNPGLVRWASYNSMDP